MDRRRRELERGWEGGGSDELALLWERVRAGERLDRASYARLAALSPDAAATYLRARLAAGELTQARIDLAALCGEPGARLVAPDVGAAEESPAAWAEAWVARFEAAERADGRDDRSCLVAPLEVVLHGIADVGGRGILPPLLVQALDQVLAHVRDGVDALDAQLELRSLVEAARDAGLGVTLEAVSLFDALDSLCIALTLTPFMEPRRDPVMDVQREVLADAVRRGAAGSPALGERLAAAGAGRVP